MRRRPARRRSRHLRRSKTRRLLTTKSPRGKDIRDERTKLVNLLGRGKVTDFSCKMVKVCAAWHVPRAVRRCRADHPRGCLCARGLSTHPAGVWAQCGDGGTAGPGARTHNTALWIMFHKTPAADAAPRKEGFEMVKTKPRLLYTVARKNYLTQPLNT